MESNFLLLPYIWFLIWKKVKWDQAVLFSISTCFCDLGKAHVKLSELCRVAIIDALVRVAVELFVQPNTLVLWRRSWMPHGNPMKRAGVLMESWCLSKRFYQRWGGFCRRWTRTSFRHFSPSLWRLRSSQLSTTRAFLWRTWAMWTWMTWPGDSLFQFGRNGKPAK